MAKKHKKYKISTIDDIYKMITIDNADNFIKDFKKIIARWLLLKTISETNGLNPKKISSKSFIWVDDGKHDIVFKFKEKNKI